ncbi:S49 family peptidase [Thalassobellus citreus]|uniref:S49 family peptidase n=1 Tax=Thalassobellus citreus TaxID=3367752 RepID=UPI0037A7F69C
MNQNAYKHEIEKGMWLLSPHVALRYLESSIDKSVKPVSLISPKDQEASFVREVIDTDGNVIDVSQQDVPEGSIGIVRCIGGMYKYGGWFNWGSDELVAMAKNFDNDPRFIGQIWHDDSGGGTVSSVPPYLDFLKNKKKPVVSLFDTCASANLWKNSGTDLMIAENNTSAMVGSLGVMLTLYNQKKMLEEYGIVEHIIESSLSEDKNKAFKLALEGKYELIRAEYLDPLALKFQEAFKAARPNLKDVPGVLTGKMFYADEALDIGMIDAIGNIEYAVDQLKFLADARSFISTNS